jgi:hypothetical protein
MDHGTWRRILYNPLKIKFVDVANQRYDAKDPFQRIADISITQKYTEDIEVRGRYLGYMVWMHYWLYNTPEFQGLVANVPHHHIKYETKKYELRQNVLTAFITQRLIKTEHAEDQFPLTDEVQKYIKWFSKTQGGVLPAKGITEMLQNSNEVKHLITSTKRGLFMTGHKFLDEGETLGDNEEYAMKGAFDLEMPADHFGIKNETPEEFYEKICKKYDLHKHIFNAEATFDVDVSRELPLNCENVEDSINTATVPIIPQREDNVEINGMILPSGIIIREREEVTLNYLTDVFNMDMDGYLPNNDDSDFEDA